MNYLIEPLNNLKSYKELKTAIEENKKSIALYGTADSQSGYLSYVLSKEINRQIVIITSDNIKAKKINEDIKNLGIENSSLYLKREVFLYDRFSKSLDNTRERLNTINNLNNGSSVLVTTLDALRDKILSKRLFNENIIEIEISKEIDLLEIEKKLVKLGYERTTQVEGVGEFAVRGSIIDIYTPENPYRIELFDIEVDSIRSFDISSQRSIENLDKIKIIPITDIIIDYENSDEIVEKINKSLKKSKIDEIYRERLEEKFKKYIENLKEGNRISNVELLIPFLDENSLSNILDYVDDRAIFLIDEPNRCIESANSYDIDFKENILEMISYGEVFKSHENILYSLDNIIFKIREHIVITLNSLSIPAKDFKPTEIINVRTKPVTNYRGKINLFIKDLKDYIYNGYKIVIMAGNEKKAKRLNSVLEEMGVSSRYEKDFNSSIKTSEIIVTESGLNEGFEIVDIKFVIINYSEIYGNSTRKKKKSKKNKSINFEDLNIGDFVVHESHGIGKYIGSKQLEVQGIKKDYIVIEYRGEDKLFLPIENLESISKYVGGEGKTPKINKLNSLEWKKTKSKAKKNIEDVAEDLIKLYAKRQEVKGFAFSEDTQWQREFEDAFEYVETDGQLESIEEIKKDMEIDKPMDRLLCADVGYGKTEVALRAAFKAIMDGKQVAFLVPTTILAQQHYNTIVNRFRDFPVEVALLSRFRTKKEQEIDIAKIRKGLVDIVIGTHRLLSKDVKFKDLGLLIIDEEQRFGVKHKEKLKMMKENIDTLTLTATPIPRTLQMSMIGIRDMSVIEEPPEERFPVQTYVLEYNDIMIRNAILKEVDRGGQVYFVYNRVSNIENKLIELRKLVPEVTFGVAHGQMSETQLENTMGSFINREFDVLLCSTIIETGMDVQNANTMIVTDSNRLGLSQLYQLRGRIGRSNKIAYAYFTYEKNLSISEIAQKRLKSIKEFTEFGSGYKIALRDLEIRGSGSVLGSRQHGHVDSIGYDLYIKYLRDTISKLKGEEIVEREDTQIDIKLDSYIPEVYIDDANTRIEIYKKISSIENEEEYSDLIDELIDRFSEIPYEVSNLMDIALLRNMAMAVGIKSIIQKGNKYEIVFNKNLDLETIIELQDNFRDIVFETSNYTIIKLLNLEHPIDEIKKCIKIINLHKKHTKLL